jgi:hypothetical protein
MTKNFAANLKIGAVMGSSVGRVFGGVNKKIKEQEATLKKLRSAYKDAAKGTGEFTGSLEKMQKEIKDSEQELKRLRGLSKLGLGGVMGKFGSTFKADAKRLAVGAGIATAAISAVGASIYSVTRGFVDWADDIGDSAEALGMSTQALQTWQFAAATVGVGGAKMTASVAKFSKAIMEGGDATDETLGKLTINAKRLRKLSLDEQLEVVAEAFKNYKGADKAAISMKLFGKSGYQLAGILSKGKQGLDDFRKAGADTGAVLTDEAAAAAGEAASVLDMFGITLVGLRNTIAIEFVPALKGMTEQFIRLVRDNGPKIREWATKFGEVLEANVVPALAKMIDRLPALIDNISKFASGFWKALDATQNFLGGWDKLGYALIAISFAPTIAAIGTMVASLWTLTGASWAAVGPWLALAAAIGGVTYVLNDLGDGDWKKGLSEAFRMIWREIEVAGELIGNFWNSVKNSFGRNFEVMITAFQDWAENTARVIREAFAAVFDWLGAQFDKLGNKLNEMWNKAKALGESVKNFFGFGSSATPTSAPITPTESMPDRSTSMNQSNSFNINVNAPGADGRRIADQIRNEFNRKPLFDMDGALAPG